MPLYIAILHLNNILYRVIGYYYSFAFFLLISFLNVLTFAHSQNILLEFFGILSPGGNNVLVVTTNSSASLSKLYDKFIGNDLIIIPCVDPNSNFPLNFRNSMFKCLKGEIIDSDGFKHYSYRQINNFFINNRNLLSCYKRYSDLNINENDSKYLKKLYANIIFESDITISHLVETQLYSKLVLDVKLVNGDHHLFIMNPINSEISNNGAEFSIESRQNIVILNEVDKKNIQYLNERTGNINYNSLLACVISLNIENSPSGWCTNIIGS